MLFKLISLSYSLHNSITIKLCIPCLLCLFSLVCNIYSMRISHISSQHQSLGKLSQVIRTNQYRPSWSLSTSPSPFLNMSSSSSSSKLTPLGSSSYSSFSFKPSTSSVFSSFLSSSSSTSNDHQSDTDNLFFIKNTPNFSSPPPPLKDSTIHTSNHRHHNHHHSSQSSTHQRGQQFLHESPPLKRFMLKNRNVTCNDGTKAGYYYRSSIGYSRRWIVFLEGGWYCFSPSTCHQRWLGMRNLMTSAHWPQSRSVGGILSPNPQENPYFWNANHVFIPYCSSDSWSGDSPAATSADLSFLGSRIITEVINELLLSKGLSDGKSLLLAGSSAGAGGVLVNLDRVADFISSTGSKIEVRGLMDSGWFLDNQPFDYSGSYSNSNDNIEDNFDEEKDDSFNEDKFDQKSFTSYGSLSPPSSPTSLSSSSSSPSSPSTCTSAINCSPIDSIKQGMKLWNGKVPESCRLKYPKEPWRCYFGYRLYPTLKTPLFVFQWIFDEAQMIADNVGAPVTKAQWNYIYQMGQELRNTLSNVSAYFAPSCISHIVLTKPNWNSIKINGTSLPQAIRCWELHSASNGSPYRRDVISRSHTNQYSSRSLVSTSFVADESRPNNGPINKTPFSPAQASLPISSVNIHSKQHYTQEQQSQNVKRSSSVIVPQLLTKTPYQSLTNFPDNSNNINKTVENYNYDSYGNRVIKKKSKRRHKKHKKRQQLEMVRSKRLAARQELIRLGYQRPQRLGKNTNCRYNLMDVCSWPQCNSGCPKLHNPFTGEEVNFLELLKSYGFNLMAVAQALGMETKTLNEMEDGALFQLFHKKVS
ncbi:palmitoleoyl-protein carboxylesterase notum1' [Tetranychus urticae]|uniref:palmitoleoyl-protein carboxylesterase notum1' n=1 Tax=Tetranychus urticae TaxID=32264 RepID=UPI00077BBC6D|nr:palmitoleoyl-protein carboxylesterase notum1' [Tetranychus urticae]